VPSSSYEEESEQKPAPSVGVKQEILEHCHGVAVVNASRESGDECADDHDGHCTTQEKNC